MYNERKSYYASSNERSDNDNRTYYGSTIDAYDVRYQDDTHSTYGISLDYLNRSKEDKNDN